MASWEVITSAYGSRKPYIGGVHVWNHHQGGLIRQKKLRQPPFWSQLCISGYKEVTVKIQQAQTLFIKMLNESTPSTFCSYSQRWCFGFKLPHIASCFFIHTWIKSNSFLGCGVCVAWHLHQEESKMLKSGRDVYFFVDFMGLIWLRNKKIQIFPHLLVFSLRLLNVTILGSGLDLGFSLQHSSAVT